MGKLELSVLEQNETLIHSLLDCGPLSGDYKTGHIIAERLRELLYMRAGLVELNDTFETTCIASAREDSSSFSSFEAVDLFSKEGGPWSYGSFDISSDGSVSEANRSGLFTHEMTTFAMLCEIICECPLAELTEEEVKKYINDLDDDYFIYRDFFDADIYEEELAEEDTAMNRAFLIEDVTMLLSEIRKAEKEGLSDKGELSTLMDDFSRIFCCCMSPSECFENLEVLMHFTFGGYSGAERHMICYQNDDVVAYKKVADSIPDCFEKRLLEDAIATFSHSCKMDSDCFPLVQVHGLSENNFFVATAFMYGTYGDGDLDIIHPFWHLAMHLIDVLAPICLEKATNSIKDLAA